MASLICLLRKQVRGQLKIFAPQILPCSYFFWKLLLYLDNEQVMFDAQKKLRTTVIVNQRKCIFKASLTLVALTM